MPENNPTPTTDAELAELKRLRSTAPSNKYLAALHNAFPGLLARLEAAERELEECPHCQNTGTAISSNASGDEYAMRCCCDAGVKRDKDRLVRELDVLMNGVEGAAKQAALCDIVAQFPRWLAARDAQQQREGAAEWLENAAREGGYYERSSEGMLEEAKQLREGGE